MGQPILTPHPSLNGLFPYHPWRIDGDSGALRCTALTSPKRRSVRTQGSLSPRTFATRLRSLTPHRTRYLCLSFSLSIHPLRISLSLFTFSFFPAWRTESQAGDRGGARSNRASVYVNGSLAVVPSCFRSFDPYNRRAATPVRPLRPAADLPAAQRGEWATYRTSTFTSVSTTECEPRTCLLICVNFQTRLKLDFPSIKVMQKF